MPQPRGRRGGIPRVPRPAAAHPGAGVAIRYWRDLRVRAAAVTWAVLEALSLGVNGPLLPFHWLQGLPLLGGHAAERLSSRGRAAAAVLAFGLDLALSSARGDGRAAAPRRPLRRAAPVWSPCSRSCAGAASGGRRHRSAGAGRLGHRVRAPAPAANASCARRACPLLAPGRGDALAGRHWPAGRFGRGAVPWPLPSGLAVPPNWGRASPMKRAVPRRAVQGNAAATAAPRPRGPRSLLAPGRLVADTSPGTRLGGSHRDSPQARRPGRAGARLAERVSQGETPRYRPCFPMGG